MAELVLPTLALTLIQPWGTLIMQDVNDWKDVENRTWFPGSRLRSGDRFWIHAGMKFESAESFTRAAAKELPRGSLLGHVRLVEATYVRTSRWHNSGCVGWYLADRVVLREPVPCKGAQGLWTVPRSVLACAEEALRG